MVKFLRANATLRLMKVDKQTSRQTNSPGVLLRCQRCSHQWSYTGRNPYFTLCPRCKTTVRMRKNSSDRVKPVAAQRS